MNKKRLWTRGAAWLLTLCLLAELCVPTVRAEEATETGPEGTAEAEIVEAQVFPPESNAEEDAGDTTPVENEEEQPTETEDDESMPGDNIDSFNPIEILSANVTKQDFSTGIDGLSGTYSFTNLTTSKEATLDAPTVTGDSLTAAVTTERGGKIFRYTYHAGQLVIDLTYTGSTQAILSFEWNATLNGGTVKVGTEDASQGNYSKKVNSGDAVSITIQSNTSSNKKTSIGISKLKLTPVDETYNTTFLPAENGYYSVNGERITAEKTVAISSKAPASVQVVANAGYKFIGFERVDTHELISDNEESLIPPENDLSVRAVFGLEDVAIFSVDGRMFGDLNYAHEYAKKNSIGVILLEQSGCIYRCDGGYTIDKGITLLIPFDKAATLSTEAPESESTWTKRTEFRCLTLKEGTKLTINGALCVNSKVVSTSGAQASIPSGPYGHIRTEQNAEIIINSNAYLYCWGYITGAGTVTLENGAVAYENFQMAGWRGGSETSKMTSSSVFPLNQYHTQNVEAALQIKSGAKLYVYVVMSVTLLGKQETTPLYFGDSGLFRLAEGTVVTRKYDPQTDRITYVVDGNFEISSLELSISSYKMNSKNFVLPLASNMTVQIRSGTTTLSNEKGAALLPGVVFKVEKGATFKVDCDLFVYDREAWVGKKFSYGSSSTRDDFEPVKFSPTQTYVRKVSDLVDAEIDVNGTLHIVGNLYTTTRTSDTEDIDTFGANIHSSEGTGKVIFDKVPGTATTTQQHIQGNGNKQTDVPITPAKLKNGSEAEDAKKYTETSGAPAGAVYYYDVDEFENGSKNWYRFNVTYVINGTSDTKQLNTETALSDVTINGTIESVTATVTKNGESESLKDANDKVVDKSYVVYDTTNKTLDISKILTAVQEYDANNDYKNMGNVTISITTNNKGSSHPMFVLSAKQLRIYQSFGGTATFTELADKPGYYLVKDAGTLTGGDECSADVKMPVPDYDKFGWYMGETKDAQEFVENKAPGLDGSVVYIYGRYSGYAVEMDGYNSINKQTRFTTIAEAMSYVTDVGNISYSLKMLADNDAFADDGGKYTIPANRDITLDLNGFTVTGTVTNNGTLTIKDGSQTDEKEGTGMVTSTSNNTITNTGTLTLSSGKFVSTGGTTAVKNSGTLNVGTGAAFNGKNAASSNVISGTANYPKGYQLSTSRVNGYFRVVLKEVTITWIDGDGNKTTSQVKQGDVPKYPGTENPVKTPGAGENCKYKFMGWLPEPTAATADAEYTAQFEKVENIRMTSGDTVDYFNTLQEAASQSPEGATLTLQKSLDAASGTATFTKTMTLNLNGQTSSGNITVNNSVTLTVTGTGTISATGTAIRNNGTLILPDGITVNATGDNSIALDNSGTIDSITGGTFTAKAATKGDNAIALRNTGKINTISGGKFQGHTAVQIEQTGVLTAISGGIFEAETGSTVICNNSTNPVTLSGSTTCFGGVDESKYVLNGVSDASKFRFDPANMTISTSKNTAGYFTIVANTFQITFNVNGKNVETVEVSRANNSIDLQSLYGSKKPSKGEGYQFAGWSLTENGAALGTPVTQTQLGTPGTGDTVTVYATWNVVYSVTITWGRLEYNYEGTTYTWDGQSMKYVVKEGDEAHWESVDTNNTVKVTNNTVATEGTVQVKAKYEKTGDYTFDLLQNNTSLTTEQMLGTVDPKGVSQSWSFFLSGTPSGNAFTKATVGKITLTLQPAT